MLNRSFLSAIVGAVAQAIGATPDEAAPKPFHRWLELGPCRRTLWFYHGRGEPRRYSGRDLRAIRATKGVGRPPRAA